MHALKRWAIALLMSFVPGLAAAEGSYGYLDGYVVADSQLDAESGQARGEADGDGFGIKGALSFGQRFFLAGEYQDTRIDDICCAIDENGEVVLDDQDNPVHVDADFNQYRAGLGLRSDSFGSALAFVMAHYIRVESDVGDASENLDGYGAHLGLRGENGRLGVTAQLGYIDLDRLKGPEYEIEADYRLLDALGLFVNYRVTDLDRENSDARLKTSDVRAGVTLYLGG